MISDTTESIGSDKNSGFCAINPVKLARQQIPLNVCENKKDSNVTVPSQNNNDVLLDGSTDINPTVTKKICFRVKSLHKYCSDGVGDSNNIPFNSLNMKTCFGEKNNHHSQGDTGSVERKKLLPGVKTKIPVLINHNDNSKISEFVQKATLVEEELHRIQHRVGNEIKKQKNDNASFNKCCKENKKSTSKTPIASTHECEKRKFYDSEAIRKYIIKKKNERKSKEIEEKIQKKSKFTTQRKTQGAAKSFPYKIDIPSCRRQINTGSNRDKMLSKTKVKIDHKLHNFEEKLSNSMKMPSQEKYNGSFNNIANATFCKLKPDTEDLQIPKISLITTPETNLYCMSNQNSNKIQDFYSTSLYGKQSNDHENSYNFFEILKKKFDSSQNTNSKERLLDNCSTLVLKPELTLSDLNMSHEPRNNSTCILDQLNPVEKSHEVDKFDGLSNEQNLNFNNAYTESEIHYFNVNKSKNKLKRARMVLKDLNNDENPNFTTESPKNSTITRLENENSEWEIKENVCGTTENQESKSSSVLMTSTEVSDNYGEEIQNEDEKLVQILKKIHNQKMILNRHLENEITALERQKNEWRKNKNDYKMKILKKKQRAILLRKTNSILELDKWEKTVIDTIEKQKNNVLENYMSLRSSLAAFSTTHQDSVNQSMDLRKSKSLILKNEIETYVGVSSTCSSIIVKDVQNKKLNDLQNTLIKANVIDRATSPMNFDNSLSKNKLMQTTKLYNETSYKYDPDQNMSIQGDMIKIKENLSPIYSPSKFYNRRQLSNSDASLSSPKDTSNSTTDQSDLEVRISALQEQLKQRKLEAERLRKEERKIRKEKLRSKEQSLIKQLEAYENYIQRISVEIQEGKKKNQSYVQDDVIASLTSNEINLNSVLENLVDEKGEFMVNNGEASSDSGRRLKNADSGILIESEAMDERSEGNFDKSASVNEKRNENNENQVSTNSKSTFLQLVVDLHSEVHSMSEQLYSSDFVEDTAEKEEEDAVANSKSERSRGAILDHANEGSSVSLVINDQKNELHRNEPSFIGSTNDNETRNEKNNAHYDQNENSVYDGSREVMDAPVHSSDMEKLAIEPIAQFNESVGEQSDSYITENGFEDNASNLNVASNNLNSSLVIHADGINKNSEPKIIIPNVNIISVTNEEVLAEETDVSESLEYDKVAVSSDDHEKQIETEGLTSRDNSEISLSNDVDRSLEEEFVADQSVPQILGDTFIVDESDLEQTFEKEDSAQYAAIVTTSFGESDEYVNDPKTTNVDHTSFLNIQNENTSSHRTCGRENGNCRHAELSENCGIISETKTVENGEVKNTNIDILEKDTVILNETDLYNDSKNYDISIESLHLQKSNTEKHIEELERQQTVSAHYSVREIPDKPPPPYVAPVSNFIHALESEELLNTVSHFIDQMTDQLNSGVYPNRLVAKQLENTRITRNSESSSYRQFVFDLAKEIVCTTIENDNLISGKNNNKSKKLSQTLMQKERVNYDKNVMFESVMKEMHEIFKVDSRENNEKLLIRWSRKKRANDPIDDLLIRELQQEEKDWTNFVEDEAKVKNNVLQYILEKLLEDTVVNCKDAMNFKNKSL